ncbi:MAG: galactokinase family protein [Acutalibacteraceae bacterium]
MTKATALQQTIRGGGYDAVFAALYGADRVSAQRARYERLLDGFIAVYGDRETALFSVPGRTEVSGNHTDHQHGRVLAAAVNIDIIAAAAPTDDGCVASRARAIPRT